MATQKQGGNNKQGNIVVQDSSNARKRFGFDGVGPITTAPKFGDMWYVEFHTVDSGALGQSLPNNRFVKAVGGVSIATSTVPIDRYGKRTYIPTRVDFGEVSISMYDTINGDTFNLMNNIYNRFFKNGSLPTDTANIESSIADINQGRKFPTSGKSFHQNFEKVVIFHFFGNLDGAPSPTDFTGTVHDQVGTGKIQKITLVNPLVTSINFSPSDYADAQLKMIDFNLQPENVTFETVTDEIAFPKWMTDGQPYILESLVSQSGIRDTEAGTNEWNNRLNDLLAQFKKDPSDVLSAVNEEQELPFWSKNTDRSSLANQTAETQALINQQKLDELTKLNNAVKFSGLPMNEFNGQDIDPAQFSNVLDAQNEIAQAEFEEAKSRHQFVEALPTNERFTDPFVPETKYPQIADFANLGNTYDGGTGRYGGSNLGGAIKNELVNAFFNGRSINWGNIRDSAAQGLLGNSGIGSIQNLSKTKQSKFGILGDLVRDGINNSNTRSGGQANQTVTVPSNGTSANATSLNNAQSSINVLKNLTRGL